MRVTAYFEDYVKAIIKEKTQLPIEKIILKEADFDSDTGSMSQIIERFSWTVCQPVFCVGVVSL